jgi:hypothetical protein
MLGEKVFTKHCNYTDAYLIEARSIGGLSGSPVFITIPRRHPIPVSKDQVGLVETGETTYLLGLVHGHFDIENLNEDAVSDIDNGRGINTGIGVVIPVEKILETIYQPELVEMRKKAAEEYRSKHGATADIGALESEDSPSAENPKHREGFNSLVDAAAQKQKQDGQT